LEYYYYIKSLHIIFVITWFAGLFYTPRLFIYFIDASKKNEPERKILMSQFKIMIYRLWYIITWPSSVLAIVFGIWLIILVPEWIREDWMIVKLVFVFILILYHIKTHFIQKNLRNELIQHSTDFMRIWNELPTIVLFSIVFLVILKSSINWIYSILSLGSLIVVIGGLIKLYKKIRESDDKKN
jgi:putative membrane protein